MKNIKHSMYLLIVSFLYSCQTTISQSMEVPKDQDSILCTKVVYTFFLDEEKEANYQIETINRFNEIKNKKKTRPNFINELYKQSQEKDKTIYFDGKKSLSEQIDNDYCFSSKTTTIRDTSTWITFHKPLKYVHFWDKYQETPPVVEEKLDSPTFTFTKKKKIILNYICEQVIVESSSNKKICWYTKQLHLKDPTNGVILFDSIPGTILGIEEYWLRFNQGEYDWQYERSIQVKSIKQVKVPFNFFEVPKGAQKMDSEQAQNLNSKRMKVATKKLSFEEKNKFLGTWILEENGFGLQLEIKNLGNNSYELIESKIEANRVNLTKSENAIFYGSNLVVNDCVSYFLNSEGQLQIEQNSFFTFTKSEDEKQLLLNSLNYWVKGEGDPEHRNKNMKSNGESNAKVEDLKEKIAKKGLKIKWMNGKYVFTN